MGALVVTGQVSTRGLATASLVSVLPAWTGVCLLDGIHRQGANCIDALNVEHI
jgi:hypothetical protein